MKTKTVAYIQASGFTLIEAAIALAILAVLVTVVISDFGFIKQKSDVDKSVQELAGVLRLAQSRTLASENNGQYGVYLNTSTTPHQYTLFRGASYAMRDTSEDQHYQLQSATEFYGVSLGGGNEIVFDKLTGTSLASGSVPIRLKSDASQVKTVYISNSGSIDFVAAPSPSDASRSKDSRHVHFNYSRVINTATEDVVLTFNGNVVRTLPITTYLSAGEFYWSGTINAGGTDQVVEVLTHRLNNPDTQFSIHRDGRHNNVTLTVTLSGDSSGNLINYAANGAATTYSSIYVSNVVWQ